MLCPECATEMREEMRSGVTLDRCSGCDGVWFDIEEIQAYLNARGTRVGQPVPRDIELAQAESGEPETCTCCETSELHRGFLRGIQYRRCSWCGGVFFAASELAKIQSETSKAPPLPPLPPQERPAPVDTVGDVIDLAKDMLKYWLS